MTIEVNESNIEEVMGVNYYRTTYEHSRREKLVDIIGEYLTDEDTSAEDLYREFKEEVQVWVEYHQKNLDKAQSVIDMIS